MSATPRRALADEAGFTLIEVLMATLLMTVILAALATVTAQWLPNWNRGIARVQRAERLALGLQRALADLSVAEMIPMNGDSRKPLFEGSELSVTLVRTAVGPNTRPGLEIIRLIEKADDQGLALVRERASFNPMPSDARPVHEKLKSLVEDQGMTAADLAEALGVSRSLASLVLSGKRRITADHAKALGKRFRLEPGYFLKGN